MGERLILLLSGINVGNAKRIAMADLRSLVGSLGYADVVTHLQSGNLVLTAPDGGDPAEVGTRVQRALADEVGLTTTVVTRTAAALAAAVAADPLTDVATDPSRHLLGFPAAAPAAGAAAAVAALAADPAPRTPNLVRLVDGHLYLWCPDGVLKSPFATVTWPKILGTTVTMRNWNTVTRLVDLATG